MATKACTPAMELSDLPPITNIQEWIGTGKKYEAVPEQVCEIYWTVISVPESYMQSLPQNSLSVLEFLQFPLPGCADSPLNSPSMGFSKESPTYKNLNLVLGNNLPDSNHLRT